MEVFAALVQKSDDGIGNFTAEKHGHFVYFVANCDKLDYRPGALWASARLFLCCAGFLKLVAPEWDLIVLYFC